mgnify:CR=1 FL=1
MSEWGMLTRRQQRSLWLIALTLAAFAWRVHTLDRQSLWRDEVDAVYFATRYLPDTLSMFVSPGQNGPLYFVSLRPWFALLGSSEFALRFPSAAAGVLSVLLTWQVARRLLPLRPGPDTSVRDERDGTVAWVAATAMAANPYQLWYAQEGKMYTVITALVLLASWWWLEGIGRGGWRPWLAYWLTVTVALYTHLLLILLFPLHLAWFLLAWPASRVHWRGYAAALAGLTLPYLPMVWWQWEMLVADTPKTGFSFTPLDAMARTLLLNQSRGFAPMSDWIWLAPLFFLGGAGTLLGAGDVASREGHATDAGLGVELSGWRRYALTATWVLLPPLTLYALSLRQPIFTDRYLIWIAPALMMVLGLGVVAVRRYAPIAGRVVAASLVIYVLGLWLHAGWQQKTLPMKYDLRSAVHAIAAQRAPDDLLILQIPHMEYAYRYYSGDFGPRPFDASDARLGPWMGGLWTNHNRPDAESRAEVDQVMRVRTAGFTRLWLLRSEAEMWDRRGLMDAWLTEHAEIVEARDFLGVQVRAYRLHQ